MRNLKTIFNRALVAVFLLIPATAALAQEEPPGNIAELWTFHVDPANQGAFEDAIKAHVALRKENGDPFNWQAFVHNTGDDFSAYYYRHCCFAWADRDAYDAWEAEHPQVEEHFDANVAPFVVSYAHDFEEIDFANSHWPEGAPDPKFVGITSYKIAPGAWQAVDAAKSELSQVAINKGWASDEHRWAWVSSVSGHPRIALVLPYNDYADMTPPEPNFYDFLSEQMGAEQAAALFERFSAGTKGSRYDIYTHRPDLSTPD